jgi:4-carboxymuconolactone decarboxylase
MSTMSYTDTVRKARPLSSVAEIHQPTAVRFPSRPRFETPTMRLPLIPPAELTDEQKQLYDDMKEVIEDNFGELITARKDGALIGPFNGWLHFPKFGRAAWAFNRAMYEHAVLPPAISQLVILVTAAKLGARYEIYGHEYLATRAGLATDKIATIVAGQRPSDLDPDERAAYDLAAALNRGGSVPETTYQAALSAFGEHGLAEIVFLVGCFCMVAATLNAFDASVPGREEHLDD